VSSVALAKTCRQMHVPVPPRGYWARKAAGKSVINIALQPRPPGLGDETMIGGGRYWRYQTTLSRDEILSPLPPQPYFEEPIQAVRNRVETTVGKVVMPKGLEHPHAIVARLLRQDDVRREKQKGTSYISIFDAVRYDSPIQKRRLRILSTVFMAVASCGGRAETYGGTPYDGPVNDFVVTVGHQAVRLRASVVDTRRRSGKGPDAKTTTEQKLLIALDPGEDGRPDGRVWEDDEKSLEQQVRDIAVTIMVKGEEQHRAGVLRAYQWRVQQQADLIERMRKEREEAERQARERQEELERKRVDRLLGEAEGLRKAREIRRYVEDVLAANRSALEPVPESEINAWSSWALAQADRIDPIQSGAFRKPDNNRN
jgi:hypothetical protein